MEDSNIKTTAEGIENNDTSDDKDSKRSVYPTRSLNYTITFVSKIYTELGANLFHSKEDIGKVHKLSVSTIKPLLSTAQQYGLLELKHGTGYKVTPLFTKIHMPVDDVERHSAVIDSLRSSQIYSIILGEYANRVFPSPTGLVNVLVRSHGMAESIAKKMVDVLLDNLKTYKLLNSSNVLLLDSKQQGHHHHKTATEKSDNSPSREEKDEADDKPQSKQQPKPVMADDNDDEEDEMIKIPIRLKGKRMAYLSFPNEYDDQDLLRIEKVIKAYVNIYNEKDDDDI